MGHSLEKAFTHVRDRPHRLDECLRALEIDVPRAVDWQRIRDLSARAAKVDGLGRG